MYLSKLEIIGFKSFANRTLLKFDAGMTAIVGPNGCGKTNVVDAIRWALGEQKASTLRSDLMENVIFNGSRLRKALGMSEVSLTIENTKGILPTEYSEVTITRRLFRSGESEYLLNKAQCRLKDIVELFMDTGMGANAYSVIELKMIETILSDRTEERRKLFEEAAGVTKYKARRKEALRRLEQVTADLEQIDAIIKEVTKNVNSLERQAERASRYNELASTLRQAEIELLEREFTRTLKSLEPLRDERQENEETKTRYLSELRRFESLIDMLSQEEEEIEERLRIAERTLRDKSETLSRLRETIAGTDERINSLAEQHELTLADITRIEGEKESLAERLAESHNIIGALEASAAENNTAREEAQKVYQEAQLELSKRHADFQQAQREAGELVIERNKLSGEAAQMQARLEEAARRTARIQSDEEELAGRQKMLRENRNDQSKAHESALRSLADAEQARREALTMRDTHKEKIELLQRESFKHQKELGQLLSKREFLTSLVEKALGTSEGAEFLLKNHSWSRNGAPMTLLDAVSTNKEYRVAIENALGEAGQYFIVKSRSEASEAIEALRHSQKGKATFIILDEVPAVDVTRSNGFTSALDVITTQNAYKPLYAVFLGHTAIVNTLDDAIAAHQSAPEIERFVTLEGEILTRSGIIRGGSRKNSEGSLVGKQQQIEEIARREAELRAKVEQLDREIQALNKEFAAIDTKELDAVLAERQTAFHDAEKVMGQTAYELERTLDALKAHEHERDEIALHIAQHKERLEDIAPMVEAQEAKYQDANRRLASLQIEMQASEQRLAAESNRFTEAQIRYTEALSAFEQKKNEILRLENDIAASDRLAEQKKADIHRFLREKEENTAKSAELKQMLAALEEEIGKSQAEHAEVSLQRKAKLELIHQHRDALREQREGHDRSLDISHQLDLKIQELESKVEQLRQAALEQFEIAGLAAKEYPAGDEFSFGAARENVLQLKSQIRNLGNVNLLAYEEFMKEKDRQEFLVTQRADLVNAQQELYQTIEEINVTATQKFLDTFDEVRRNFQEIFRSLFTEGDECELQLEDGDPLEAQIEIIAKPRGKKPHGIESLSGGEKTMTAIALLFAIYLVKPSPFCILDEVDAPLDDANIDRFLQLVRRFAVDTQFIVVTHNKRTMAAADALYGVTQEEDGVSKIVSVRLKRELAQAA